jgi:putative nucleotidyltransferase with HDIG domain
VTGEARPDRSAGNARASLGTGSGGPSPHVAPVAEPLVVITTVAQCLRDGPDLDGSIEGALGVVREQLRLHSIQLVPVDGHAILAAGQPSESDLSLRKSAERALGAGGKPILDSGPDHSVLCLLAEDTRHPWVLCCRRGAEAPFAPDDVELLLVIGTVLSGWLDRVGLLDDLRDAEEDSMLGLATALASRDRYTGSHVGAVQLYADRLAQRLGLDEEARRAVRMGSILHDIGKIGVHDLILQKVGPLTDPEMRQMKMHTTMGAQIVERMRHLHRALPIVLHHHERWDGQGYPSGLKGEERPLGARIVAVVDSFHSMTSSRPYRKALSDAEALAELRRGSGVQFDPRIIDAFMTMHEQIEPGAG